MNRLAARRTRIMRLRAAEHRAAAARLLKADSELGNLGRIEARLTSLRQTLGASAGVSTGQTLQALAEMAQRIGHAQTGLTRPIAAAARHRDAANQQRQAAKMREDGSARLLDRSIKADEAACERREDANRPFRLRDRILGEA